MFNDLTSAENVMNAPTASSGTVETETNANSVWRILILPPRRQHVVGDAIMEPSLSYLRSDEAQPAGPSRPTINWTTEVGFHRKIVEYRDTLGSKAASIHPTNVLRSISKRKLKRQEPAAGIGAPAAESSNDQPPGGDKMRLRLLDMLAEAAHDIRSPIATAQQILTTVTDGVRNKGSLSRSELGLLDIAKLRLTQAIKWAEGILLDRSLEQGKAVSVRSRFYPQQWQTHIRPLLESIAAQRGVRLKWEGWEHSLPRLYLDANHLSRAILNLVVNSIHASRAGQTVRIIIDRPNSLSQRLVLHVVDSGPGLPPGLLREVNALAAWPDFRRSDKLLPDGSQGLGLKTAKTLIREMGGSISAELPSCGGTRFCLNLPIDNPAVLVRDWLMQCSASAVVHAGGRLRVSIHVVRVQELDLDFADSQLQRSAGVNDLIYRVTKDRWLWLNLSSVPIANSPGQACERVNQFASRLNELGAGKSKVCLVNEVFKSAAFTWKSIDHDGAVSKHLASLVNSIVGKARELMDGKVPPLDRIQERESPILVRSTHSSQSPTFLRADRPTERTPHLGRRTAKKLKIGSPESKLTQALVELADHWHTTQSKLSKAQNMRADRPLPNHVPAPALIDQKALIH